MHFFNTPEFIIFLFYKVESGTIIIINLLLLFPVTVYMCVIIIGDTCCLFIFRTECL